MDLETLLETRNLSRNDVGPPVELIPNEDDPSLLDLYVRGGDSADSITLSDQGTAILVSLNGTDYGPLTPTGEIFVFGHQGADAIRIDGGLGLPCSVFGDEGSDVIQVTNRATPQLQVSGGTGTDTLQGDSVDRTWTIQGLGVGMLDSGATFLDIENLTGGDKADHFVFEGGGSIAGALDGKDGNDELDFSGASAQSMKLTSEGDIDGFSGVETDASTSFKSFANINMIAANPQVQNDKITGLDTNATWTVSDDGVHYERMDNHHGIDITDFDILVGGTGIDVFNVESLGAAIAMNGGDGDDQFEIGTGDLNAISGRMNIVGGHGQKNMLDVNDNLNQLNVNYLVTPSLLESPNATRFGSQRLVPAQPERLFTGIDYDGTIENLNVEASDGANEFTVEPSRDTTFFLNGNLPVPGSVGH